MSELKSLSEIRAESPPTPESSFIYNRKIILGIATIQPNTSGMSARQKRLAELGLATDNQPQINPTIQPNTSGMSARQKLLTELGLATDNQPQTPIRTKEDATLLYSEIKKGNVEIKSLSKETQNTLKKYLDENGGNLEIPKENQVDWSQYGIDVTAADKRLEQEKQITEQKKQIEEQKQISLTQEKNTFNYQTTYHLDSSALFGIGMVCVTVLLIICMVLFKRKTRS